jgi:hypothetical protein
MYRLHWAQGKDFQANLLSIVAAIHRIIHGFHYRRPKRFGKFVLEMDKSHSSYKTLHICINKSLVSVLLTPYVGFATLCQNTVCFQHWLHIFCIHSLKEKVWLKNSGSRDSETWFNTSVHDMINVASSPISWQQPHNFRVRKPTQTACPPIPHLQMLEEFRNKTYTQQKRATRADTDMRTENWIFTAYEWHSTQ